VAVLRDEDASLEPLADDVRGGLGHRGGGLSGGDEAHGGARREAGRRSAGPEDVAVARKEPGDGAPRLHGLDGGDAKGL
jgi:hypothetical protein